MGWWLLAKACMIAYVVLLLRCVAKGTPSWTFAPFIALLLIGLYAEYRADASRAAEPKR